MDAVPSWKAYIAVTNAGSGAYGKECARLRQYGMSAVVQTHFIEASEVRPPSPSTQSKTHSHRSLSPSICIFLARLYSILKQTSPPLAFPSLPPPLHPCAQEEFASIHLPRLCASFEQGGRGDGGLAHLSADPGDDASAWVDTAVPQGIAVSGHSRRPEAHTHTDTPNR